MRRLLRLFLGVYKVLFERIRGKRISILAFVSPECHFEGAVFIDRFCNIQQTKLGKFTYIGYGSTLSHASIGRFCSIASNVKIGLGMHPVNQVSTSPVFYSHQNVFHKKWSKESSNTPEWLEVTIGHDVWIGANAIVMGGVHIGHGAVIAAGAVVTKDVTPYAVVGGVPAKLIRMRFPDNVVQSLLESRWWENDEDRLMVETRFFCDPVAFLHHREQNREARKLTK